MHVLILSAACHTHSINTNVTAPFVAFVPILGAILLIVPGGMGVRSSLLLLDQSGNAAQGTAFALQMIVVALGIAVGLFASTLIVYPRKSIHHLFYSESNL
jgi:uncharacterized membrane protein YjjB (DUF3815 family)